jgi:hypothetical protein
LQGLAVVGLFSAATGVEGAGKPKSSGEWTVNGFTASPSIPIGAANHTVARLWIEQLLNAIRGDLSRPTVHARNLFHVSLAMWDAWAVYSANAYPFLTPEHVNSANLEAARKESISFAAYRVIQARFGASPGAAQTMAAINVQMDALGYNKNNFLTVGNSPAAVGNRIAINVLSFGLADNANEQGNYANLHYLPVNPPLAPDLPGNPQDITCADPPNCPDGIIDYVLDPNRWQPLDISVFIDQGGNVIFGGYPAAVSPEWGQVTPFALSPLELTIYNREPPAQDADYDYWVYHDPGPPPLFGEFYYKWGFEMNILWSSHHTTDDGVMWDISPASVGNAPTPDPSEYLDYYDYMDGGDWGTGYPVNPITGQPYTPQIVPRGDYTRCLTEFWSDGPASETPPGHWFTILNYVSDHPLTVKRLGGQGPILPDLEWDVKTYLALGGAVHDTAVTIWGIKGWYDYIRPISVVRYMAGLGQCTDPKADSYDVNGLDLIPGRIELVTEESILPGERHEHLAGENNENVGKIAIYAWRGPPNIPLPGPVSEVAGVGWILAENWWSFFPISFVSPPFPGFPSGHSGFSRAGALVMTALTGSEYFPGGMSEFYLPAGEYLDVEDGPSVDVTLQWARYQDGSDQCSLSRLWGGIHPPQDDLPSRIIGETTGPEAFALAQSLYEGSGYIPCPSDIDDPPNSGVGITDFLKLFELWGTDPGGPPDFDGNGNVGAEDMNFLLAHWGPCPS